MRILGIDPGTVVTGYGVVEESPSGLSLIESGGIRTSTRLSLPGRLRQIYEGLMKVMENTPLDAAAVENTFLSKNFATALKLGQACGVALLAAELSGLRVHGYTPAEVKLAVAGYGAADKRQVREMIGRLVSGASPGSTGLDPSHHASDAVAVAVCHLHSRVVRERMEQARA